MVGRRASNKSAAAETPNSTAAIQAGCQRHPVHAESNAPPTAMRASEKYLREGVKRATGRLTIPGYHRARSVGVLRQLFLTTCVFFCLALKHIAFRRNRRVKPPRYFVVERSAFPVGRPVHYSGNPRHSPERLGATGVYLQERHPVASDLTKQVIGGP